MKCHQFTTTIDFSESSPSTEEQPRWFVSASKDFDPSTWLCLGGHLAPGGPRPREHQRAHIRQVDFSESVSSRPTAPGRGRNPRGALGCGECSACCMASAHGSSSQVLHTATRLPALWDEPEMYSTGMNAGTDAVVEVPITRFDVTAYFTDPHWQLTVSPRPEPT